MNTQLLGALLSSKAGSAVSCLDLGVNGEKRAQRSSCQQKLGNHHTNQHTEMFLSNSKGENGFSFKKNNPNPSLGGSFVARSCM